MSNDRNGWCRPRTWPTSWATRSDRPIPSSHTSGSSVTASAQHGSPPPGADGAYPRTPMLSIASSASELPTTTRTGITRVPASAPRSDTRSAAHRKRCGFRSPESRIRYCRSGPNTLSPTTSILPFSRSALKSSERPRRSRRSTDVSRLHSACGYRYSSSARTAGPSTRCLSDAGVTVTAPPGAT